MSFTAHINPTPAIELIPASGFWPAIDPNAFRSVMRVDNSVTNDRVLDALLQAIVDVTIDLDDFATEAISNGYLTLVTTPLPSTLLPADYYLILYTRAIFSLAKARILEAYRDYDTSRIAGNDRAAPKDASTDFYYRDSRFAISSILGKPRISCDLI